MEHKGAEFCALIVLYVARKEYIMPVWLAPAITAAGGIASALLSRRGGNDMPPYGHQIQAQFDYQREVTKRRPKWLAEGALKAGYHPLAVLGMNPASGPVIKVGPGDDKGRAYGRAIEYGARGLSEIARLNSTLGKEQVRGARLDNDIKEKTLEKMGQTPVTPRGPFGVMQREEEYVEGQPGPLYMRTPTVTSRVRGLQEGVAPEERTVVDQFGWVKETLSEPIQEAAESDWFFNIQRVITKGARHAYTWFAGYGPANNNFRKLVRNVEMRRSKLPPLGPGEEYRFDILRNSFRISRRGKYPRLFTNTSAEIAYRNVIKRRGRRN